MQTRNLGTLTTSAIGFGAMVLVDGMYGHADDERSLATLTHAIDAGATLIDTADAYAAGANERLVGRAIARPRRPARDQVGHRLRGRPPDRSTRTPRRSSSTRGPSARARRPRPACSGSASTRSTSGTCTSRTRACPVEETVGAMAELVAEGKVRHLGLSNVTAEQVIAAHQVHPLAAVQGEYSLWTRDPERELLPVLQRARHRVRALVAARRGLPRRLGGPDRRRLPRQPPALQAREPGRATATASRRCAASRPSSSSRPRSSRWPGCCTRRRTSSRSPAPARRAIWTRTSPPPTSSLDAATLVKIEELAPAGAAAGSALL